MKILISAEKIADELKKSGYAKAVALGGSLATGFIDRYSDIDMFCYGDEIPDESARRKLFEQTGCQEIATAFMKPVKYSSDIFGVDGYTTTVDWIEIKDLDKKVKEFLTGNYQNEVYMATLIQDIKKTYDPERILKEWQKSTRKYPEKLKENKCLIQPPMVMERLFYNLNKDYRRGQFNFIDGKIIDAVKTIIQAVYSLNNTYYPYEKWFESKFKEFETKPKKAAQRIRRISELNVAEHLRRSQKSFLSSSGTQRRLFPRKSGK